MDLKNLFDTSKEKLYFEKGEAIFTEGEDGSMMYVVISGEVEVHIRGELFISVGEGEIVGEMALIDQRPRSANAVAKTDCELVPVDEKQFVFMVQQTPFFSLHVMRTLVERLRIMDEKF